MAVAGKERPAGDPQVLRSAFTIFRDQIITRDCQLGRRPRIAHADYWDSVKAAWSTLEPERKQAYKDEAASERDMVMARRRKGKGQWLAARSIPSAADRVGLALRDGVAASSPQEQQLELQPAQGGPRPTVYINQALETSLAHSELAAPAMPSLHGNSFTQISRYPLPEPLFAEYLKRNYGCIRQRCVGFKEKCQKMQGGNDFPKKVRYPSHCGAACSQTVSEDRFICIIHSHIALVLVL